MESERARFEFFMKEALSEASKAFNSGEVPVGAVVVRGDEIISRGHNLVESSFDPSSHAELVAIREASMRLSNWRLTDCAIFVTLEPCTMCAGAILLARIPTLVFGAHDTDIGAVGSKYDLFEGSKVRVISGILQRESSELLSSFFTSKRR